MTASQILIDLSNKPRTVIEADLRRIQQERQRLEAEEAALQAFLRWRQMEEEGKDGKPEEAAPPLKPERQRGPGRAGPSIPDLLMQIMGRSFEPWPIPKAIEAVRAERPETRDEAVRTALRRLEERDKLFRDQHGNYRVSPGNANPGMLLPSEPQLGGEQG